MNRLVPFTSFCAFVAAVLPGQKLSFRAAADYSKSLDGLAVLVYQHDKVVFEEYHNGYEASKPHHIYSGTKSFAPLIALVAEGEGLLTLDEPVARTITEWKGDEQKGKITIRHLLTFTSGLKNIDSLLHGRRSRDSYAESIAGPMASDPGKRFKYGSNHLMVFGELMRRKLSSHEDSSVAGKDVLAYLENRILDPIGMKHGRWIRDRKKNPALPYGAFVTAREWAKFGLLVLHRGKHDQKQIVPARHFDQCFVGTKANPVYGLNWWLVGKRVRGESSVPKDTVGALGMYNQKLYVIPSAKMVIVRFGKSPSAKRFRDAQFLERLFATAGAGESAGRDKIEKKAAVRKTVIR